MGDANELLPPGADPTAVRAEWIAAVNELVTRIEGWCKEFDWATRRALKQLKDKPIGAYEVPMLLIQQWDVKLLLEPISRFVAGANGRVDLYTMPEYDDMAVLTRENGDWVLLRVEFGRERWPAMSLTCDTFKQVIETFVDRRTEIGPEFVACP